LGLAQSAEGRADQPLCVREVGSFGGQLPFKAETTGIIAAQGVFFGMVFEPVDRMFGDLQVSEPERNGATTPNQCVT